MGFRCIKGIHSSNCVKGIDEDEGVELLVNDWRAVPTAGYFLIHNYRIILFVRVNIDAHNKNS